MKKFFTLGALGLLASFGASAQIMLDGRVMPSEIGTGMGMYQSMGQFNNSPRGFGDWGIKEAFIGEDANFVYVAVHGTVENNGNAFQIYFDVPNFPGIAACSPLPAAPSASGDPTSFASMTAIMEMEVDAGVAYSVRGTSATAIGTPQLELTDYRTPVPAAVVLGSMTSDGTPATFLAGAATAAYKDSPQPTPPASTLGGVLSTNTNEALEFRVAKAAYSLTNGMDMKVFVVMNSGSGDFLSTDFIPSVPTGGNLGGSPDFCVDVPGTQYVTFRLGTGLLGTRKVAAGDLNFSVAPNPVSGQGATVSFTLDKPQAATVVVTDLLGRQVATLAKDVTMMGEQKLSLKAAGLNAGQYIVKLQLGDKVATRKVSVL